MTIEEGQNRTKSLANAVIAQKKRDTSSQKTRAPSQCSLCCSLEHTARICPQRYSTI